MLSNTEIARRLSSRTLGGSEKSENVRRSKQTACPSCSMNHTLFAEEIEGGCMTCGGQLINNNPLMASKKKPSELLTTEKMKDVLELIVNDESKSYLFGSYVYMGQLYPSDIDMHEIIYGCCKASNVYEKTVRILKKMVKKVDNKRGIYFSEVKAGIDHRFMIDVNDKDFIKKIGRLRDQELIKPRELRAMILLYEKNTQESIAQLEEMLRLMYTVRWSDKEILKGWKYLEGKKKLTLLEAVSDPDSMIKIDIWAPINGRYIEITNFFILVIYDSKTGKFKILNDQHEGQSYLQQMQDQVWKLSHPPHTNYFKMAKRMWNVARHIEDRNVIRKLNPLFQGSLARLNQIKADIDVLVMMFDKLDSLPIKTIMAEINDFKVRIANIYDLDIDLGAIGEMIDEIIDLNTGKKTDTTKISAKLEKMKKYISDIISEGTLEYLESVQLWPIPDAFYRLKSDISGSYSDYLKRTYFGGQADDSIDQIVADTVKNEIRNGNFDYASLILERAPLGGKLLREIKTLAAEYMV